MFPSLMTSNFNDDFMDKQGKDCGILKNRFGSHSQIYFYYVQKEGKSIIRSDYLAKLQSFFNLFKTKEELEAKFEMETCK